MPDLAVDLRTSDLAALCKAHRVKTLDLFGSAVDGRFEPARSDLDFIVDFERTADGLYAGKFLTFLVDLEDLYGRHIDLLTEDSAAKAPFRRYVARRQVFPS